MDDPMLSHRFHHASWWTMNVVNPKYPNRGLVSGPWCQRKNEDKCKPLQPLKQQPQTITQPLGKYMPATLHKFCFFAPCHFWTTSCDQQRIGVHQFIPICLNHIESTFVMFKRLNHATSNMFMVKSNMFMVRHVHGSIIHFSWVISQPLGQAACFLASLWSERRPGASRRPPRASSVSPRWTTLQRCSHGTIKGKLLWFIFRQAMFDYQRAMVLWWCFDGGMQSQPPNEWGWA